MDLIPGLAIASRISNGSLGIWQTPTEVAPSWPADIRGGKPKSFAALEVVCRFGVHDFQMQIGEHEVTTIIVPSGESSRGNRRANLPGIIGP